MNVSIHPAAVERAMSAAQQLLASLGDDADEVLRRDLLDGETDALEIVRRLVRVALEAEALSHAAQARINALDARRGRFEAQAEAARSTARDMLEVLEVPKLVAEDFTVSVRRLPPKVLVPEPERLAAKFWRETVNRNPDKTLIAAALADGREVPGAVLGNGGLSLTIRTK